MNNFFYSSSLILENGLKFNGYSPTLLDNPIVGEVVFTTSMVGYVETLTDPSYTGQILCFTYPIIGSYGIPAKKFWESKKIHASAVIICNIFNKPKHTQSIQSLIDWLSENKVPCIMHVDTRHLTQVIRGSKSLIGALSQKANQTLNFIDPSKKNLVSQATVRKQISYGKSGKKVILIDCGVKHSQIRHLSQFPIEIVRVPFDFNFLEMRFDGLFISSGPGDPTQCKITIKHLEKALSLKKPIFGICLGMQLLAAASGAKIYKLPYGHRGQNQPCMHIASKRCYITAQNHGYAVESKLPKDWEPTFVNLNDQTLEGFQHQTLPYFAVQFHPEAHGGPRETSFLFKEFYNLL